MPLSLIIITNRNDQRFLKSLKSAQFADEVLIIDNASGNDWQKLRQQFHFQVENLPGKINNFADVRNNAMDKAKNRWVMFLDSDEVLSKGAKNKIEQVLADKNTDGATITRTDVFLGKELKFGEAGSKKMLRIFKKDLAHFNRAVHEVAKVGGTVVETEIEIKHYAHNTISEFITDISWYAETMAQQRLLNKPELLLKLVFYPPGKFVFNYFFKLGFLDGWRGLVYAVIMSIHSFSVRAFIYEQNKKVPSTP